MLSVYSDCDSSSAVLPLQVGIDIYNWRSHNDKRLASAQDIQTIRIDLYKDILQTVPLYMWLCTPVRTQPSK